MPMMHTTFATFSFHQRWLSQCRTVEFFLPFGCVLHAVSLAASSFVEEEHQTYYFLATSVHVALLLRLAQRLCVSDVKKTTDCQSLSGGVTCSQVDKSSLDEGEHGSYSQLSQSYENGENHAKELYQELNSTRQINPAEDVRSRSTKRVSFAAKICSDLGGDDDEIELQDMFPKTSCLTVRSAAELAISLTCILLSLRVLRQWNQTGNKWQHLPDFGDWLSL